MPAGRPTDYTPELIQKAREYIDGFDNGEGVVPTIAGLSLHIGIARATVYAWQKEEGKEEFSDIVEQVMAKQEHTLEEKGLTGKFNSSITKLMLTKHGLHDKQELSTDPDAPLIPILNVTINKS